MKKVTLLLLASSFVLAGSTKELLIVKGEILTQNSKVSDLVVDRNKLSGDIVASSPKNDARQRLLDGEELVAEAERGRYCDKKFFYDSVENAVYVTESGTFKGEYRDECSETADIKYRIFECKGMLRNCKWINYLYSRGSIGREVVTFAIGGNRIGFDSRVTITYCTPRTNCNGVDSFWSFKVVN